MDEISLVDEDPSNTLDEQVENDKDCLETEVVLHLAAEHFVVQLSVVASEFVLCHLINFLSRIDLVFFKCLLNFFSVFAQEVLAVARHV